MKIEGYKIPLKNEAHLCDYYDKELSFFVFVLPDKDKDDMLMWDVYIAVDGFGLIEDVVGVYQKDIADVAEWISNLDENEYFNPFKEELALVAY